LGKKKDEEVKPHFIFEADYCESLKIQIRVPRAPCCHPPSLPPSLPLAYSFPPSGGGHAGDGAARGGDHLEGGEGLGGVGLHERVVLHRLWVLPEVRRSQPPGGEGCYTGEAFIHIFGGK